MGSDMDKPGVVRRGCRVPVSREGGRTAIYVYVFNIFERLKRPRGWIIQPGTHPGMLPRHMLDSINASIKLTKKKYNTPTPRYPT